MVHDHGYDFEYDQMRFDPLGRSFLTHFYGKSTNVYCCRIQP